MTNNRQNAVSRAVSAVKSQSSLITLSTGVVLKPDRVPNMIFPELMGRFERPKPPRVFIADLGREEENPADPDYNSRVEAWQSEFTKAIVDAMIVLGTRVVSVPDGFPDQNDTLFIRQLRVLKISVNDDIERYLLWVKMVAAPSEEDIQKIMEEVGRLSGVSEKDVSEAVEQFRDNS